jgi:hypothetical protein
MPTITGTPVKAFAHCRDARCPGYQQEEIDAVREETSFTFGDGDRLGAGVLQNTVEKSHVEYRAASAGDAPCRVCGVPREVTGERRKQYVNESGFDPMGLLSMPKFDEAAAPPAAVLGESDAEMEDRLRREIREEQMRERLRQEMSG